MSDLDIDMIRQRLVLFGLVSEQNVSEIWEETEKTREPEVLLRALEKKSLLTPWQSSKLLKGDEDGFFLGGYRILYKISSGSFGRVFRAEDVHGGRLVAIKVLRRRWSEDKQRIALFMREGKMGMTIKHPNIVETLAVDQDPTTKQYFIVMEFVEGGNVREMLKIWNKLDPDQAFRLMEDVVQGLAYAHAQGITHRDIKLTNILIASNGTAKLVDFGLAQIFSSMGGRESDEHVERTIDYAALEKLTGVKAGDVRSDIYFLGTVLYQMLTGRSPIIWGRDRHARMNPNRFKDVPPIEREEVDAPGSVFQVVETMMSLSPTERYQTPTQLLEAIRVARRDIAKAQGKVLEKTGPRSVFVVEGDLKLQEAIRAKLKERGYRVFMAMDPMRALDRFRMQPYDALVIDAGTTGEEGMLIFDRIMGEAIRQDIDTSGILVLSEDQSVWVNRVGERPRQQILVRPVTLKQLYRGLDSLMGVSAKS